MATNPSFTAVVAILSVFLLFLLYYLIRKHNIISGLIFSPRRNPVIPYFSEKLIGFLLFGIIPFFIIKIILN